MKKTALLILIIAFLVGLLIYKHLGSDNDEAVAANQISANLPMMLELGSDKCMACKMMEPVLEELRENYSDKFSVQFHDVWKNTDIAVKYGIDSIPTQIFLDNKGQEVFRHTGFYAADEIVAKWNELGVVIEQGQSRAWLMQDIYLGINSGIKSSYISIALLASFLWGILSLVLSPCHLTSIPLLVAYISGQGEVKSKRAFGISLMFSAGLLLSILLIGLITSIFGRMFFGISRYGYYFIAFVFLIAGSHLLGLLPEFWRSPAEKVARFKGMAGAFMIGLVFGMALGPCTFAYMAPVLAVTMGAAKTNMLLSLFLIVVYAIGHCLMIVLSSTCTPLVDKLVSLNSSSISMKFFKSAIAFLVLFAGGYILYIAPPLF